MVIEIVRDSDRVVSGRDADFPIIDLNYAGLRDLFGGAKRVKAEFARGRIFVAAHPDELAAEEGLARILGKLKAGQPLDAGSVLHGGGIKLKV